MEMTSFISRHVAAILLVWFLPALAARSQPIITQQPTNQSVLNGGTAMFSVTATGTGPLTYQWQLNGTNLPTSIITTVAGGGAGGDGGAATNAILSSPFAVAVDTSGNAFIADSGDERVRKVSTNGIITTAAGRGGFGQYSGDGGAATNAYLNGPNGVAVDALGNLFIADRGNMRIREVGANGIINTMAGTNASGFSGDGGSATNARLNWPSAVALDAAGNVFIADQSNHRIRRVDTKGIIATMAGTGTSGYAGDGGFATNARLNMPTGIAVDVSGNLFIADEYNHRVRKVNTDGIITTVAGNGNATFQGDAGAATNASLHFPQGVAADLTGNLFIADAYNNRIRKVDTNGTITTFAGGGVNYPGEGGAATAAYLWMPHGVAVDGAGNLFIADTGTSRVRKVITTPQGPVLTLTNLTAANSGSYRIIVTDSSGSVTSSVAALTVTYAPAITAQPPNLFVTNGAGANFIVSASGTPPLSFQWRCNAFTLMDGGDISGSTTTNLTLSGALTNNLYDVFITNAWGSVVSRVALLTVFAPPAVTRNPTNQNVVAGSSASFSVSVDGTGPFAYQWQLNGTNLPSTNVITTVAGNGSAGYSGDGDTATNASLSYPSDAVWDAAGNLFIADTGNNVIRRASTNGIIMTVAGNGSAGYSGDGGAATSASLNLPTGVALDGFGAIFIADFGNQRVRKVSSDGIITTVAGNGTNAYSGDGGAATNASLFYPYGVAVDVLGNLFIADRNNSRIREVRPDGSILTVAGIGSAAFSGDGGAATNAQLFYPTGVALDAEGNMLIADMGNQRIRMVNINGLISTLAGDNYVGGYSGDSGAAINARLYSPERVAVDSHGNLFIADNQNQRIRKVDASGIITTVAGNGSVGYSGDGSAATNARIRYPTGVAVDAGGNILIADHDNCRIRRVDNPQGPILQLNSVTSLNAGDYQVVATSPYGSVTSTVATLAVTIPRTPPQIITGDGSFGVQSNKSGFHLSGAFGQTIVVDGSTNLVDWLPLSTSTVSGSLIYFSDPGWTNYGWRFYRGRLQ